jgi:hypothetical protein
MFYSYTRSFVVDLLAIVLNECTESNPVFYQAMVKLVRELTADEWNDLLYITERNSNHRVAECVVAFDELKRLALLRNTPDEIMRHWPNVLAIIDEAIDNQYIVVDDNL